MLDSAVHMFGVAMTNALNSVEGRNPADTEKKRTRELHHWLGTQQTFKDPGKAKKKKTDDEEMSFEVKG